MDHDHHKEFQFLINPTSSSSSSKPQFKFRPPITDSFEVGPSLDLDLQLSICVRGPPMKKKKIISSSTRPPLPAAGSINPRADSVEALRWHAAEQIQLAAGEKAYAEKVREMTRREMELAQSEFNRAKRVWERAREEVEKAELIKERATRRVDSACMEITCHSCSHKFRPLN